MKGAFPLLLTLLSALGAGAALAAGPAQAVGFEGRDGTRITGWLMLLRPRAGLASAGPRP